MRRNVTARIKAANLYAMDSNITPKAVVPAQQGSGLPPGFHEMIDDLKSIVRGAHVRAQLKVNTEMLRMYWEIGRTILERQQGKKWGTKVVDRIATELRTEFPNQRGFSRSNLHYMQQMARTWPDSIVQQAVGQLPWGHIVTLMSKCKTRFELDFYAQHAVHHGWSRDHLGSMIHTKLHLAEGAAANNFDVTLPAGSDAGSRSSGTRTASTSPSWRAGPPSGTWRMLSSPTSSGS